jgi:hypothetical protein
LLARSTSDAPVGDAFVRCCFELLVCLSVVVVKTMTLGIRGPRILILSGLEPSIFLHNRFKLRCP